MKKIIKNIKYSEGPAQYRRRKSSGSGFVLLFAVTLAAILLSIALGVTNIALKEIKFGTSAKDANDAFFAADTGAECALVYDKSDPTKNAFTGSVSTMICAGIYFTPPTPSPANFWSFTVSGLGSGGQGCAVVTVTKTFSPNTAKIVSKGYNNGGSVQGFCTQSSNTIERELDVNY
jgi:hypothetical protein